MLSLYQSKKIFPDSRVEILSNKRKEKNRIERGGVRESEKRV